MRVTHAINSIYKLICFFEIIINNICHLCSSIFCSERYVVIYLIANVYLSCVCTRDRLLIYEDILENISAWRAHYPDCELIIARDINVDLDSSDHTSVLTNDFCKTLFCLTLYLGVIVYLVERNVTPIRTRLLTITGLLILANFLLLLRI